MAQPVHRLNHQNILSSPNNSIPDLRSHPARSLRFSYLVLPQRFEALVCSTARIRKLPPQLHVVVPAQEPIHPVLKTFNITDVICNREAVSHAGRRGGRHVCHAHVFTIGPGLIPSCFITSLPLKNGLIVHASCKPTSSRWLATVSNPQRPIRKGLEAKRSSRQGYCKTHRLCTGLRFRGVSG